MAMKEDERGALRKTLGHLMYGASFVTLPLGVLAATKFILAGELLKGAVASGFVASDLVTIKEHGQKKLSWYNPERWMNKVLDWFSPNRGSQRFDHNYQLPTSKMVYAAA
jgi:hypothetical protein